MLPTTTIRIHPQALAEARAIFIWYGGAGAAAAEGWLAELEYGLERIAAEPHVFPRYIHRTRRLLLRRYPYAVVYVDRLGQPFVIALPHARRRVGYRRHRLH